MIYKLHLTWGVSDREMWERILLRPMTVESTLKKNIVLSIVGACAQRHWTGERHTALFDRGQECNWQRHLRMRTEWINQRRSFVNGEKNSIWHSRHVHHTSLALKWFRNASNANLNVRTEDHRFICCDDREELAVPFWIVRSDFERWNVSFHLSSNTEVDLQRRRNLATAAVEEGLYGITFKRFVVVEWDRKRWNQHTCAVHPLPSAFLLHQPYHRQAKQNRESIDAHGEPSLTAWGLFSTGLFSSLISFSSIVDLLLLLLWYLYLRNVNRCLSLKRSASKLTHGACVDFSASTPREIFDPVARRMTLKDQPAAIEQLQRDDEQ